MWKIRLVISLALFAISPAVRAQAQAAPQLTVSYTGNFLIHPGLRVGYEFPIEGLPVGESSQLRSFLRPQIGTFTYIDRNTNYLLGADLGVRRQKTGKKSAAALSLGLNYLGESEKLGFAVNLGSGDRSDVQREWRHYFLPTLNYQWSTAIGKKNRCFTQVNWGYALSTKRESEMYLLLDIGIKFSMKKT